MAAVLAIALMVLTGTVYWASSNVHRGQYWADHICAGAQGLCDAPWLLLIATGVAIVLALLRQMLKT